MLKKLSVAVSAALVSSSVFAVVPTANPQIEIFMSGASAQDKGIASLFTDLCVSGTLDVMKNDSTSTPGKAHTSYFCEIDSAKITGGTPVNGVNPTVLFHKRSAGGSGQGVNPVIAGGEIDSMDIDNGNCAETSAGSGEWICTLDLVQRVPDAGVSDVNPELFVGENTPAGQAPVDPNAVANVLEVRGAAALVFGIPVTTGLRNALQEAQFGLGDACVGVDTEACMPSLSRNQVASLMTGQIRTWDKFQVNGVALTDPSVTSAAPTNTQVHVCRRVNGSGTQAQMSAKFLNYPCTAGALPPAGASSNNFFIGPVVLENSGSGNVTGCLNDLANSTNDEGHFDDALPPFLNQGSRVAWGVGIQSTEKNGLPVDPQGNLTGDPVEEDFRFVKIDGVAPTLENAANGSYLDVVEQTFQWRKASVTNPANTVNPATTPALTGDALNIVSTIAARAADPAVLAGVSLNRQFQHTYGQGGYLALSTNGNGVDDQFDIANPVTPFTHVSGSTLDNCRVPVVNGDINNDSGF